MMISVIMPVYNGENTVSRSIDSVLSQTHPNFELIIVNDGSTDSTDEILAKYAAADPRIKVFNQANAGVSAARNTALDKVSGDYVAFIDADDVAQPDWLAAMAAAVGDCDMCCGGLKYYLKGEYHESVLSPKKNLTESIVELHTLSVHGYVSTKLIKRSILDDNNLRFRQDVSFREDDLFVASVIEHINSMAILPLTPYIYFSPDSPSKYKHRYSLIADDYFAIYRRVFNDRFPREFCIMNLRTAQEEMIYLIKNGIRPSSNLNKAYKLLVRGAKQNENIKEKFLFGIIANARLCLPLASWLLNKLYH